MVSPAGPGSSFQQAQAPVIALDSSVPVTLKLMHHHGPQQPASWIPEQPENGGHYSAACWQPGACAPAGGAAYDCRQAGVAAAGLAAWWLVTRCQQSLDL